MGTTCYCETLSDTENCKKERTGEGDETIFKEKDCNFINWILKSYVIHVLIHFGVFKPDFRSMHDLLLN